MSTVDLTELQVADSPQQWAAAGFAVVDDSCQVGAVRLRFVGREHGTGIVGWALSGLDADVADLDGVPTQAAAPAGASSPAAHPNGVTSVDHVVLMSPHLPRTVAALAAIGVEPRRERDGVLGGAAIRQVFFRLGATILEVVGSPDAESDGPSSLWGITFVVEDIDASVALLGDHASPVKDAVQPGRRITTLRHRELDLSVRTALITPHVRSADR